MDLKTGGLSSEKKQRDAAAEIARRKVLKSYEEEETKTVSKEDWKKYHSAWQDYYQKYYSEYYMNAAKEYVAREQVKKLREEANLAEKGLKKEGEVSEVGSAFKNQEKHGSTNNYDEKSFKQKIQEKVLERSKLVSRRRWLMPIFFGAAVVFTILFLQYNRLIFAPLAAYVSPGEQPSTEISAVDPTVTLTKVSAENKLVIPKLNIDVPINFEVAIDDVMEAMNNGVAHYRISGASAYPGEIGNFVITGHSAGDIYSSNQYKFIFSGLERLEPGDIIYVHYNQVRYTYKMTGSEIIEPTEVEKLILETDKPMLTLITCWPLGTSRYRLLVRAEQISPSYVGAEVAKSDENVYVFDADSEMPKNEKTFFERIFDWLIGR